MEPSRQPLTEPRRRIAVVEDETALRQSVVEYLDLQGFDAVGVADGTGLRALLDDGDVDLVLLDLRLPGEDGLSILRRLREVSTLPVIMVTAMGDPVDRVVGLEVGADDYVAKPFEFRELLARIRSVLRRNPSADPVLRPQGAADGAPPVQRRVVRVGRVGFDLDAHVLIEPDGTVAPLTRMEYDLLAVLVARPNRVLSRDQLLDLAHDGSWEPFDRSIDIRIARLRKKVESDPAQPRAIRTVRGSGYMFVP